MTNKLEKALRKQNKSTQKKRTELSGTMGVIINGIQTVEVANRAGFVYVLLNTKEQELIQAFNDKVSGVYGLSVIVIWNINRYEVVKKDDVRYATWNSNYLPKHGNQHSFNPDGGGAGDVSFIYGKQFVPLSLTPSGTFGAPVAIIAPYSQQEDGWHYIPSTTTPDITQFKPTNNQARMVLVCLEWNTRTPQLIIGTGTFAANLTGSADVIPYLPSTTGVSQIPIAGVRLVSGTTAVTWQNIYDVRQYFHPVFTGTSAGGGGGGSSIDTIGVGGLSNGTPIGTGTFLNVTGDGATFTRSGTYLTLNIPGGDGSEAWALVAGSGTLTMSGSNTLPIPLGTEIYDPDDLVDYHADGGGDKYLWFNEGGWYYWRIKVSVSVNGGIAATNNGDLIVYGNPGGTGEDGSYYHYWRSGTLAQQGIEISGLAFMTPPESNYTNSLDVYATYNGTDTVVLDCTEVYVIKKATGTVGGGSGGGGSSADTIGIAGMDEGVPVGTGTVLNVRGSRAVLSRSGTVLALDISPDPAELIGLYGQNQGINLGTGTVLNVNGSRLNMTLSGTVFNLTNSPDPIDNIGIMGYDDSTPIGTGTSIVFGSNLTAVRTGTFIFVDAQGGGGGGGSGDVVVYDDSVFVATGTKISFNKNLTVEATGTSVFVTSPITTYFRVGVPTQLAGNFYRVPDGVYASGSLGVFNNGLALIIGTDYAEQLWVSGTYQYLNTYTGTHLVHYGVPCSPQTQPPTGTEGGGAGQFDLQDSDSVLLLDSDGIQLSDSDG